MHLQDHLGRKAAFFELACNLDHGHLDDVCRAALHGMVHSRALGKAAQIGVFGVDIGRVTLTPKHRGRIAVCAGILFGLVQIGPDTGIGLVVALDHLFGLLHGDMQALPQAKRALPVDDAKVYRLSATALLGRHICKRHPKDLRSRCGMKILPAVKRGDKPLVPAQMREQPELYLRVIGTHKDRALRRNKGLADMAAQLCPNGNVLQVGIT